MVTTIEGEDYPIRDVGNGYEIQMGGEWVAEGIARQRLSGETLNDILGEEDSR